MSSKDVVIVSAARTPFGSFGGTLKDVSAVDLGAAAIKEAIDRVGVTELPVDEVIMGMVVADGAGMIPARQAALKAGLPDETPVLQIGKVCASGMKAIALGAQVIRAGDAEVIIAGGMESMSNYPYLMSGARWGLRMGDGKVEDAILKDGLTCGKHGVHMAVHGSTVAAELGISREEQDAWAYRSQMRWQAAESAGRFNEERFAFEVKSRKGSVLFEKDEFPRPDTTLERLAKLSPVFTKDGSVTAGNAPGVNDGAGAVVIMTREKADALGLKPLATIVAHAQVAQEPRYIATVPGLAIQKVLPKAGITVDQLKRVEINEAFAAVPITSGKIMGVSPEFMEERVNVNGGAVAVGHPIGASGARILMTLLYELRRHGGGYGAAAICSGMAQGDAMVIRVD